MNWPNRKVLWLIAAAGLSITLCTGCGTVIPKSAKDKVASFDGNEQNSGFLGFTNNFGIITPHARERYNILIAAYGIRFQPPLLTDAGLQPTNLPPHGIVYMIDREHLVKFATMNRWKKAESNFRK